MAGLPVNGEVLVVDDEPLVAGFLARRLRAAGCVCHLAGTYEAALQELERFERIKLVILDHGVWPSDIGGFARKVRSLRGETVIVGSSGTDCQREFAEAGVCYFLRKPWSLEDLIQVLGRDERETVSNGPPDPAAGSRLRPGAKVRLVGGSLDALTGIVVGLPHPGRLTILADGLIQRGVLLEIDQDAVAELP